MAIIRLIHPISILRASSLPPLEVKGEFGEGGCSGGGCTGVTTSSLLIKDNGHAGDLRVGGLYM